MVSVSTMIDIRNAVVENEWPDQYSTEIDEIMDAGIQVKDEYTHDLVVMKAWILCSRNIPRSLFYNTAQSLNKWIGLRSKLNLPAEESARNLFLYSAMQFNPLSDELEDSGLRLNVIPYDMGGLGLLTDLERGVAEPKLFDSSEKAIPGLTLGVQAAVMANSGCLGVRNPVDWLMDQLSTLKEPGSRVIGLSHLLLLKSELDRCTVLRELTT